MSNTSAVVLDWVKANCLKDKPNLVLKEETSFLANNVLDSLSFLHLVTFLEQQFSIKVDEDDMSPDNFESAQSVAALVDRLRGA
ncbi:MAG TPA: acyl carrier protein [Thiobacillaceae bacterium]|nr:acyl carrier protein [Thiobacillaceae bacterium]HNA81217.1 acyl carrier protein [Thiobacillaceae bacterium]HNF87835.1 acyl carrier protein [Thiobacillaceae bacterium]HNH87787.1 acyl carrier protein [Thiobacillaceae bacterium]HNI06497.1 acyl carrier protein [Thiobacillaceae bacterium]